MWISKKCPGNRPNPIMGMVVASLLCGVTLALDTSESKVVPSNVVQILPKDAIHPSPKNTATTHATTDDQDDLKTDATVAHSSEPAPEFYRGVSAATEPIRDRKYDRYGSGGGTSGGSASWLSLDKESLYKNPYIANAYHKLTSGAGISTPAVSSLVSPNASYKDRYDHSSSSYTYPSSNDYVSNNKYGGYGTGSSASTYGSSSSYYGNNLSGGIGAPYGPPQTLDYNNHYGGSSSGYDSNYGSHGSRPSYGHNSIYGSTGYGTGYNQHKYGGGDFISSKFGKSSILPLAGAALLGVAATLVANPMLLNFGLGVGKRKRRSVEALEKLRAKYEGQKLAYRGHRGGN